MKRNSDLRIEPTLKKPTVSEQLCPEFEVIWKDIHIRVRSKYGLFLLCIAIVLGLVVGHLLGIQSSS